MIDSDDNTERGRIDKILDAREKQLQEALAIAHLGSWEWDVEQGAISWSPELKRIFGVVDGFRPTVSSFLELVHPEDRAWAAKAAKTTQETGFSEEIPFRIIRPDGSVRIVRARGTISRSRMGKPVLLVGVIQDLGDGSMIPGFNSNDTALDSLSAREREVLLLVVQGKTSKAIAKTLSLSDKTVDTYRSRIMKKLGVENVAHLVRYFLFHGYRGL
ncbi:MAG TPA: LuxR C-terminal-related transcriptional regulator [Burkholderiales bacterium]|nr:LuxR C-terminal-related transcriptional regulator [Burkholderiales bacterium]